MNNEELRKKYSSGSLLKKINCNGRTIKVESLDENTKERITKRVLASVRQYVIEEQNALTGKTSEKVFKKAR